MKPPFSSPAIAVTTLKVEPGGYVAKSGRCRKGRRGSLASALYASALSPAMKALGSNRG